MQEPNILGEKRAAKLSKLARKGVPVEDALMKVWPKPKVEPVNDAWNYLVKEKMIAFYDNDDRIRAAWDYLINQKIIEVTDEPCISEQYQNKIAPFIKWGDDVVIRWVASAYSSYHRKELEIRDVLTELVRRQIPDFRKEDKALLEKAAQENMEGSLEERSERFYALLGVNVVNRASTTGLLKFRPHQTNGEKLYLYSCMEDNFGEFSKDIKMLPPGDYL